MSRGWISHGAVVGWASVVAAAAASIPALCLAAEITDVADAADTERIGNFSRDDAFDLYLGAEFESQLGQGRITREPIDRPGIDPNDPTACTERNARDCRPVDELNYKRVVNLLNLSGQMGLYHDLAITFGWHFVIGDSLKFSWAKNLGPDNSTIEPATGPVLFEHNFASKHMGPGPIDLGLKWAPLSDERDESKPSWVLYFNWANPWGEKTYNPSDRASSSSPGPVGDGVHRLTFGMALSKRVANLGLIGIDPNLPRRGYMDPYFDLSYTLPVPQQGYARAENMPNSSFGELPSHIGRISAGFEVVPLEDIKQGNKLAIDLGLRATYYSQGRNYSELTDPLEELTYTDQYMYVGGIFGIYAQLAQFTRLKASVVAGYVTSHFLTNEDVGHDLNNDGQVTVADDSMNPYFCGNTTGDTCSRLGVYPYDQVGFRFRDERHILVKLFVSLMFAF